MGHRSGSSISNVFTFALVALFAVLALLLAVIGVNVYQHVLASADNNNQARASLNYVANKIRAGDMEGQITLEERDNLPVLVLQDSNTPDYDLSFYYYNSTLMEQYGRKDVAFQPERGEALVRLDAYEVAEVAPGLFSFSVLTTDGKAYTMHVALRSGISEEGRRR